MSANVIAARQILLSMGRNPNIYSDRNVILLAKRLRDRMRRPVKGY